MMPSNDYYDQNVTTNIACGQPVSLATGYLTNGYASVPRIVVAGPVVSDNGQEITMQPYHHQSHPQLDHQVAGPHGLGDSSILSPSSNNVHIYHLGVCGWKRLLFYLLFLAIVLLVIINSVLTIWIMTIIGLSTDGIGRLQMTSQGAKLNGDAFLQKDVYANIISAPQDGSILRVVSSNEININGLDAMGGDTTSRGLDVVVSSEAEATASASSSTRSSGQSSLVEQSKPIKRASIGPSRVTVSTSQLVIRGPNGKLLLMVDEANVVLATDKLRVNNPTGIKFNCSLQAPLIDSLKELKLQSVTRSVRVLGPKGVDLDSDRNSIRLTALKHLSLRSSHHQITINASRLELRNLRTALPTKRGRTYPGIQQLCMCPDTGLLFADHAEGHCRFEVDICRPSN